MSETPENSRRPVQNQFLAQNIGESMDVTLTAVSSNNPTYINNLTVGIYHIKIPIHSHNRDAVAQW